MRNSSSIRCFTCLKYNRVSFSKIIWTAVLKISKFSRKHQWCSSFLEQLLINLPTNCLSVFDHFVGLALKGLKTTLKIWEKATKCNLTILPKVMKCSWVSVKHISAGNYMFKVKNKNTRTRRKVCSKFTIKTPKRYWRRSGIFIMNFEHLSHLALIFLLLTFSRQTPTGLW